MPHISTLIPRDGLPPDYILRNDTAFDMILGPVMRKQIALQQGPKFLSLPLQCFLYGLIIAELFKYRASWKTDHWVIKSVIVSCTGLTTFATIWLILYWWKIVIKNYGHYRIHLSFLMYWQLPFIGVWAFAAFIVQSFFVHRIYKLWAPIWWVPVVAAVLTLFGFIVILVKVGGMASHHTYLESGPGTVAFQLLPQYIHIVCDIFITVSIVYKLLHSRTGWSASDRLITRIIRLSVASQTGPTLFYLAACIQMSIRRNWSLIAVPFLYTSSSVYFLAVLILLNSRAETRRVGRNTETYGDTIELNLEEISKRSKVSGKGDGLAFTFAHESQIPTSHPAKKLESVNDGDSLKTNEAEAMEGNSKVDLIHKKPGTKIEERYAEPFAV